jgi:hypothetical protein
MASINDESLKFAKFLLKMQEEKGVFGLRPIYYVEG